MELNGELFSTGTLLWIGLLYAFVLLSAVRMAAWRTLLDTEQLHVFLGACVALLLLWHVRAEAGPTLSFHLLGVTTLTLMFGWSFGIIGASIALLGVTLNGRAEWEAFTINALLLGILPISLTQLSLLLARAYLPKNFFIFVLVNGFLTAGAVAVVSGYAAVGILGASGTTSYQELSNTIIPFFPLMFMPEAFINGWAVTALVCYRPQWIHSFSDKLYLRGK
jgi:uncharacterized membrane protein